MRLHCLLQDILDGRDWDSEEAAQFLEMDKRSLDRILNDEPDWRLGRKALRNLMLLAFDAGHLHGEIFELKPHPLWETFLNSPIKLVRHQTARHDSDVEKLLRDFLAKLDVRALEAQFIEEDEAQVEEMMKSSNCIFVGSPRSNPSSEIATALLWGARPFDSNAVNRARVPLQFHGLETDRPSCFVQGGARRALVGKGGQSIKVDWRPQEEYQRFRGQGTDAAAVFYCRSPLGTEEEVSTLVICGFTGRATLRATAQLTHSDQLTFYDRDVSTPGKELAAALGFRYSKRLGRGPLDPLRTDLDGSEWWGTPSRMRPRPLEQTSEGHVPVRQPKRRAGRTSA